jgi:hypothetical protein
MAKRADKEGTHDLLSSLNTALGEDALGSDVLEKAFSKYWDDLKAAIDDIGPPMEAPSDRTTDSKVDEMLMLTRDIHREASALRNQLPAIVERISDPLRISLTTLPLTGTLFTQSPLIDLAASPMTGPLKLSTLGGPTNEPTPGS